MTTSIAARVVSRRLDLNGTYNVRDVGGYPLGEGATKWHKLFRSDALHALDQAGRDALRELNLDLVIDLRESHEVEKAPNALQGVGHREVHVPVYDGAIDIAGTGFDLTALYLQMVTDHAAALTSAVRLIAASGSAPVLVHCTAGKDRTGLVIALTLAAVGVDERDIIADYVVSETMLAGEWSARMVEAFKAYDLPAGFDIDEMVCASPAVLMRATLTYLDDTHGGVQPFLLAHGMTESELADLRACLIG
ncbi:tyrosine-protein phosphatase [Rhodococcus sp. IEGM 1379]|uniref:tyrosine-protein phosphatase n=1 Tax=Rhodococcus sp. IEGM 1379 TaxID=3047086 RepID=UPI0024B7E99A|nr:tyrosine-protein phosphatase [Rhodococcus sp. IEGM 1379]MDI9918289.1 tyrosine-protein phosphatase [Rhodococcus sp. IEGM 1379]